MYCLFLRLEISPSIQSWFEDTKGWPSLFWSKESNDLFYWAKLAFNQTSRHRHCEVWIERVNTPPWVVTILIVTTVHPVQFIFGIAKRILLTNTFRTTFKTTQFSQVLRGELESFDLWNSSSPDPPPPKRVFRLPLLILENHRPSDDASLIEISRGPARWYLLEMYESNCRVRLEWFKLSHVIHENLLMLRENTEASLCLLDSLNLLISLK